MFLTTINISILYVLLYIIFIIESMRIYSQIVGDKTKEILDNNQRLSSEIKPILNTGSVELFTKQRDIYSNLFVLLLILIGKIIIIISLFILVDYAIPILITTPFNLPILFDMNTLQFVSTMKASSVITSFFLYFIIYKIVLYSFKTITNSDKNG